MPTFDIASYVRGLPLYDVHEHHMPETLHDREVGLLKLLEQSYAGWTQARPYPLSPTTSRSPSLPSARAPGRTSRATSTAAARTRS